MRKDSLGLFWEDIDQKTEKKQTILSEEGWQQVFPGFWAETRLLESGEEPRNICLGLELAYQMARKSRDSGEKCEPPEPTWLSPSYLPGLAEAREFNIPMFTDAELIEASLEYAMYGKRHQLIFDIECYGNYFLIAFMSVELGKVAYFELSEWSDLYIDKLNWVFEKFTVIGFNSNNYDIFIASMAIHGCSTAAMKAATSAIIVENIRGWQVLKQYKAKKIECDHIDIMEVAPLFGSLKIYGGRMHSKRMQDLPFHPDTVLSEPQIAITRWYCVNDLRTTLELYLAIKKDIELREEMSIEYGVDVRSRSDAQIAESVIRSEIEALNGYRAQQPSYEPGTIFKYNLPDFIEFQTPLMQGTLSKILNSNFVVSEYGNIGLPPHLKEMKIRIGDSVYQMGIGGLHSSEKKTSHFADNFYELSDWDVTSYYPFIILNQGLYPEHLGPNFLIVYRDLVNRRIAAKRAGDTRTADSLKIVINGSFGKLGSSFSVLYSPQLLIQVTITGQLSLLMLIEALELAGIPVVNANTDGIVIKCPHQMIETRNKILDWWQAKTDFNLENTRYKALYSRDVNNYIAVKHPDTWKDTDTIEDRVKTKGVFANPGLSKNPQNEICTIAIKNLLIHNTPISDTIRSCTDITKFLTIRTVKGGGVKVWEEIPPPKHNTKEELLNKAGYFEIYDGMWRTKTGGELAVVPFEEAYNQARIDLTTPKKTEYLGKAVRWYYAKNIPGGLVYANSGKKVATSDGAKPLMDLPNEFPDDIDYEYYEKVAYKILKQIAYME